MPKPFFDVDGAVRTETPYFIGDTRAFSGDTIGNLSSAFHKGGALLADAGSQSLILIHTIILGISVPWTSKYIKNEYFPASRIAISKSLDRK
jgi:hypothetical protein